MNDKFSSNCSVDNTIEKCDGDCCKDSWKHIQKEIDEMIMEVREKGASLAFCILENKK